MFKESRRPKSPLRRRIEWGFTLFAVAYVSIISAPQALAWPHKTVIGDTSIYSETQISGAIGAVLGKSDALLRKSAIYSNGYGKSIFLTNGGWRWRMLALRSSGAFALSRGGTETIIINTSSVDEDWVRSPMALGRQRRLSGIITHERTHGLIRAKYGSFASALFPTWKVEGYADYIAQESSLTAADVARYKQRGEDHPAIVYYEGRQKVAAFLAANNGSVDQLFAAK
jgi:hypothetical protein